MCNNHSNGHAHGVRTNEEKVSADLRDDLAEKLKSITRLEAQLPVIESEEFPLVNEVTSVVSQIVREEKRHAAALVKLINKMDEVQSGMFLKGAVLEDEEEGQSEQVILKKPGS